MHACAQVYYLTEVAALMPLRENAYDAAVGE